MPTLPEFNPQISPQNLISNNKSLKESVMNESLYLGKRGFKILEKGCETKDYIKIDQQKFDQLINEVIIRPATTKDEEKKLAALYFRELTVKTAKEEAQITQIADQTIRPEKSHYTEEQLIKKYGELFEDLSVVEGDPDKQIKKEILEFVNDLAPIMKNLDGILEKEDLSDQIRKLLELKNKLGQLEFKFSETHKDPEFIQFIEESLNLHIAQKWEIVNEHLNSAFQLRTREKASQERCWQGNCTYLRIDHLLQERGEGSYLLHIDTTGYNTLCSFFKDGQIETYYLEIRESQTPHEAVQQLMGDTIDAKPVNTKPLSFYQSQLDWHATDQDPTVFLTKMEEGDCWITRTEELDRYKIHVYQESGDELSYDLVATEDGIHVIDIPLKAERLHELFEDTRFPGNYFLYELFGLPLTVEEVYFRHVMKTIPKGSDEVKAVYNEFRETPIAYGDRGNIQVIEQVATQTLGKGTYNIYYATRPDRSSIHSKKFAIGVPASADPETLAFYQEGVETIGRIQEKVDTLKYNLLPRKLEYYHPIHKESYYVKMARMAPGGNLERHCGHLTPNGQIRAAHAIFAGAKELLDNGIIKRDIKPANILCVGSDESDPKPMHSDHDESIFLDDPIPVGLVTSPQYASPNFIRTYRLFELQSTKKDLLNDQIYSIGATLYEMCTGKSPDFGREKYEHYEIGTPLYPNKVLAEDDFFKSVGSGEDSIEQLIWDSILVDRDKKQVPLANEITLEDAMQRIEKLLNAIQTE